MREPDTFDRSTGMACPVLRAGRMAAAAGWRQVAIHLPRSSTVARTSTSASIAVRPGCCRWTSDQRAGFRLGRGGWYATARYRRPSAPGSSAPRPPPASHGPPAWPPGSWRRRPGRSRAARARRGLRPLHPVSSPGGVGWRRGVVANGLRDGVGRDRAVGGGPDGPSVPEHDYLRRLVTHARARRHFLSELAVPAHVHDKHVDVDLAHRLVGTRTAPHPGSCRNKTTGRACDRSHARSSPEMSLTATRRAAANAAAVQAAARSDGPAPSRQWPAPSRPVVARPHAGGGRRR